MVHKNITLYTAVYVDLASTSPLSPPVVLGRAPWFYYYPIEGIVYDLDFSGDVAVLHTSHGVLRYRYTGISVKYLRIPDSRITRITMIFTAIMFVIIALIVLSSVNTGFGLLFGTSPSGFFRLFTLLIIVSAIFAAFTLISAWRSKPVLVLIDHAGVEHYYIIDSESRDRILRIVVSPQ